MITTLTEVRINDLNSIFPLLANNPSLIPGLHILPAQSQAAAINSYLNSRAYPPEYIHALSTSTNPNERELAADYRYMNSQQVMQFSTIYVAAQERRPTAAAQRRQQKFTDYIRTFAELLEGNTHLLSLEISDINFSGERLQILMNVINHSNIQELCLNNTELNSNDVNVLANILATNVTLKKLNISGNPELHEKDLEQLQEALTANRRGAEAITLITTNSLKLSS